MMEDKETRRQENKTIVMNLMEYKKTRKQEYKTIVMKQMENKKTRKQDNRYDENKNNKNQVRNELQLHEKLHGQLYENYMFNTNSWTSA